MRRFPSNLTENKQLLISFATVLSHFAESFMDCLWPDISFQRLESAIIYYDNCRQTFGK